ncbi:MAG: ABC transporter permease [Treponema sp.]|nr:ABC transporter permease [Treponema sp.]
MKASKKNAGNKKNASKWIGFVAARYLGRSHKNSPSMILSVLGIATGVLALTVILAVMNGFQLGFIESILEISSAHLRLEGFPPETINGADGINNIIEQISLLPGVLSVLPFLENNVLLRGEHSNPRGALIRGLPADALERDPGLAGRLDIESGSFDLSTAHNGRHSIVLGAELARHLSVRVGDELSLLSIAGALQGEEDAGARRFTVTGLFRSHYYEYDLGWAFINLETARELLSMSREVLPAASPVLGIKLSNRWQDQRAMNEIEKVMALDMAYNGVTPDGVLLSSWRDYNRAFFAALRTEKLMMFILVGLIFIVVGLNIFQAQRRTVLERWEEIGLLRALGASDKAVRLIFVFDGIIIGFAGAGLGLLLGLLIAFNIPAVFSFLEGLVNMFISFFNFALGLLGFDGGAEEFTLFSPQIFYIKEIPSRVIPQELLFISLFGLFSAVLAAWFASGKVSNARPAEVLRYE